ncbi:KTSC domain-containing protein [Corallococcus terminator]|uniref:KTSC domain-containing protein n=1 Tax=Corallococcus terminator TaxID=2316733 RepID=A0A3A8J6X6_9BACT|nr:KTSC domain-containing protein [Corallococcus terminator]RKG91462.1 KTSC domain-containing protein [Corallococcus terminator]
MHRTPVASGNILSIGYDPASQTLEVEFTNRHVYQYLGVPAAQHRALMQAASHGEYLAAFIKGHFRYQQVG